MSQICFDRYLFYTCMAIYIIHYLFFSKDTDNSIPNINIQIPNIQIPNKEPNKELNYQERLEHNFLNKIYNPLAPPENMYSGNYNAYNNYQNVGYLTGNNTSEQFPVYARQKYSNNSDKMEYYIINEGRNRIKIPFKTRNFNEMYDGDIQDIPELNGSFKFTKYENQDVRYNPLIF